MSIGIQINPTPTEESTGCGLILFELILATNLTDEKYAARLVFQTLGGHRHRTIPKNYARKFCKGKPPFSLHDKTPSIKILQWRANVPLGIVMPMDDGYTVNDVQKTINLQSSIHHPSVDEQKNQLPDFDTHT